MNERSAMILVFVVQLEIPLIWNLLYLILFA
jgi:hypothetical protein